MVVKYKIMEILILTGYFYIVYVLIINGLKSFKENNKLPLLNIIGIIIMLIYLIKHLIENIL